MLYEFVFVVRLLVINFTKRLAPKSVRKKLGLKFWNDINDICCNRPASVCDSNP